jgi:hypothetical protein
MEERRGDRAIAVKKRWLWRSVRAMLMHGERGRRVGGGWWRTAGFFPFYGGRGGRGVVKVGELPTLMG